MGSESQEKVQSKVTRQRRILIVIMGACLISLILSPAFRNSIAFQNDHQEDFVTHPFLPASPHDDTNFLAKKKNEDNNKLSSKQQEKEVNYSNLVSFYQNSCNTAAAIPKQPTSSSSSSTTNNNTTKPIWMPMLPFTIPESLHKDLINPMTNTSHGAKSFYSSIKGKLRHCIGNGLSITCLNVHPSVEMTKGMPDSKSNEFSQHYIMVLRNPMTALPAGYNAKAAKYSGVVGQLPREEWRKVRDEWFDGMLESWEKLIMTWKATKYSVGMYLVYEDLLDIHAGMETMKNMRLFLIKEGFQVVPEEELDCIWFKAVGKDNLERFYKRRYEYDDYIPGFTMEQKDKMIKGLTRMKQQFKDDMELVQILERYIDEIKNNIKID